MEALILWLSSLSIQQIASWLFVLITLSAFSKRVRRKFMEVFFSTKSLLLDHINDERITLDKILAELRRNDGSSLRDAIDRIEHQQKHFDAFLSAQLNIHNLAIVRTNDEGELIYANRYYQRILGVSIHEVLGEGWINVIHPDDRARVQRLWQEAVSAKREFNEDIKFVTSFGKVLEGHANVYREVDRDGQLRGWLGVIHFNDPDCKESTSCLEQMIELLGESGAYSKD